MNQLRYLFLTALLIITQSPHSKAASIFDPILAVEIEYDPTTLVRVVDDESDFLPIQLFFDPVVYLSGKLLTGRPSKTVSVQTPLLDLRITPDDMLIFDSTAPGQIKRLRGFLVGENSTGH